MSAQPMFVSCLQVDPLASECWHYIAARVGHWEWYYGIADEMATALRAGRMVKLVVEEVPCQNVIMRSLQPRLEVR